MRILWLSHLIPYPPKGGVLQRSFNLLRELAKHHDVDLLAFNQRGLIGPLFSSVEAGVEEAHEVIGGICKRHQFFEIPSEVQMGGKYRLALKSIFTAPYNINWLESKLFSNTLTEWTRDRPYDLVHFDTISLAPFLKFIPPKTPTVLDHHNIESHMLMRRAKNEKNVGKKFYFFQEGFRLQRHEKTYCPKFSLNITCSDVDTHRLKLISPGSAVETVPNGVDTEYFKPGREKLGLKLVFVGRLNWYPNQQAVNFITNELWPALKKKWPDIEFDLGGSNPPDASLKLAKQDANFRVHGFVDDMRPLVAAATIYICPIQDGGGTKLKVLDALAMGKALIAHPIACEGIAVTEGKDVLFATTPADYIKHIEELLRAPEQKISLQRHGRELVESTYSYSAIGKDLAEKYASLSSMPIPK